MKNNLHTTKFILLSVTYSCNLRCSYCYEPKQLKRDMDMRTAKSIIEHAFIDFKDDYNHIEFDLLGGEPLLRFDFIKELSEWMINTYPNEKFTVFASTNGTLLNEEMKQWFIRNKEIVVLGLSYDGTPLMQDLNRSKSSYAIDIDFFLQTWPLQHFKMTLSPSTLPFLSKGIFHLESLGAFGTHVNLAYGINWSVDDLKIYRRELNILVEHYSHHPTTRRISLLSLDLPELLLHNSKYPKRYCGCGNGTIFYDYDGNSYPCHMFSPIVLDSEFVKGVDNIDFNNDNTFFPPECYNCLLNQACPRCYGIEYKLNSNVSSPTAFQCKAFKIQVLENAILQQNLLQYESDNVRKRLVELALNKITKLNF